MIRRRLSTSSVLILFSIVAAVLAEAATVPAPTGVKVQAILKEAQRAGVEIIFSSELVPPELTAPEPQEADTPLLRAAAVLAPNGLALRAIGVGKFVVVKVDPSQLADLATRPEPVLEEISIYASRYSIGRRSVIAPKMITQADIQAIPGSHDDPLRALQALPGLATTVSARPYIRGSLADDVLVRYDGVTLLDPFHLKNFQSLYSAIDPLAVDSMEVYSGGYPVRYGTRSGGVIDITPPTHVRGYHNALTLSLIAAGAATSGTSERWPLEWLATARRSTTDLLIEPLDVGHGNPRLIDATGRLKWTVNPKSDWTAGWLLLDDRIELGLLGDEATATARYRDEYAWLVFQYRANNHWHSRTTVAVASSERTRDGIVQRPSISSGTLSESRSYHKTELSSDWTYEPGTATSAALGAAVATTDSEYRYTRQLLLAPAIVAAFGRPASDNLSGSGSPHARAYSAYGSVRHRWPSIEAEFGLRIDGQDYRNDASQKQWSPRVNVRYDLNHRWHAYGSIGRFTQAQAVEEWRTEELQQVADPAQNALHSVVGLAYDTGVGSRWSLEIYRKRWTTVSPYFDSQLDRLALLPDLAPDRVRIVPENSEASGVELSVHRPLTDRLQGWASLTAARVTDEFAGNDGRRSWDQPLALNAGAAWSGAHASVSLMAGWHTGWPRTAISRISANGAAAFALGARNADRWNDYLSLDMKASWTYPTLVGELTTFLEITNTANRRNDCCTVLLPAAAGTTAPQFETATWLPLVLNLGITFHWRSDPK